ncbi:hypothetical protein G6F37_013679 [Rhizopus arrhizus]|nr:hypothetical protein G6F38_013617 [Rhizopus arrhizus]KAG1136687.1 hypothetical protein G6F37_013679 [Rhizopus arrhizus]
MGYYQSADQGVYQRLWSPTCGLEETVEIAILKAERTWRERGETDAEYLKKSASARQAQRSVLMLRNPATGDICSNQEQMLGVTLTPISMRPSLYSG